MKFMKQAMKMMLLENKKITNTAVEIIVTIRTVNIKLMIPKVKMISTVQKIIMITQGNMKI